jgi:alpha-beta hydrolase superfamily lysophospholipase
MTERHFTTWDGTKLFYRAWLPSEASESTPRRALILFHRGHEHSGRLDEIARRLGGTDFAVFAWDARGHGKSPGERGWAESFAALVRDADAFAKHITREYCIVPENMAVVAHSVGAVIAAAWVHDYAPRIRAMVLASPAFRVKLYVPFALPFLRVRRKFQPKSFVTSYVRPGMLTHDTAEAKSYAADPLISRAVSVNLLVEMYDTAERIVANAAAIHTPTLLLSSGKDFVVKLPVQRKFFHRLSSVLKEMREYETFYHDLWHERDRTWPIDHTRDFLRRAFAAPVAPEVPPANVETYERLSLRPSPIGGLAWTGQRAFLKIAGKLSSGIATGWRSGFDSGDSLDYVYRNQTNGVSPIGRLIDRIYLDSPGWRGIRQRRANLEELLSRAIVLVRAEGKPAHIFDPAAGTGRYVLETVQRVGGAPIEVTLRDWNAANVQAASELARACRVAEFHAEQGDAFDRASLAAVKPPPGIVIVSGLYELFADNLMVRQSLGGLADAMSEGGYLIYTNQPWHPQLEMIARVLRNREGKPWVMRCRSQAEIDALVHAAGFEKIDTLLDRDGIFTVSLARRRTFTRQRESKLSRASGEHI